MKTKHDYKYYYLAITIEPIKGKYFSYVERISENENLVWVINRINHITTADIMPTKKKAYETVDLWNEAYKKNGTFLLDDKEYRKNPTKYY
jgi:hypothetical protein